MPRRPGFLQPDTTGEGVYGPPLQETRRRGRTGGPPPVLLSGRAVPTLQQPGMTHKNLAGNV